jgi:hypothetical protein
MKTNPSIPEKIIALLEEISFENLTAVQKEEVQKYLTKEEYIKLHRMYQQMEGHFVEDRLIHSPENLNKRFAASIIKKSKSGAFIPLWQAAAVIILMTAGWVITALIQSESKTLVQNIHDTVYVASKEPSVIIKTDTVILYKTVFKSEKDIQKATSTIKSAIREEEPAIEMTSSTGGIRVINNDELHYLLEQKKSRSMAEDSLYRRIGFAGI